MSSSVGWPGTVESQTMPGLEGARIGIFAMGRIGSRLAEMVQAFRPKSVSYFSSHQHQDLEDAFNLKFVNEQTLFAESDVLFIAAPDEIGDQHFNDELLSRLPDNALVVSISRNRLFDFEAAAKALRRGVTWAQDDPVPEMEAEFGPEKWFTNRGHNVLQLQ